MLTKAGCVSAVFAVLVCATWAQADQLKCGAGTVKVKGTCVPDYSAICGTGTQLVSGQCVSSTQCPVCGNGNVESGEECDDGAANGSSGSNCDTYCHVIVCGNGRVESPEECDDGNTLTETCPYGTPTCAVCGFDCNLAVAHGPYCGDGSVDVLNGEECDLGPANGSSGSNCDAGCHLVP